MPKPSHFSATIRSICKTHYKQRHAPENTKRLGSSSNFDEATAVWRVIIAKACATRCGLEHDVKSTFSWTRWHSAHNICRMKRYECAPEIETTWGIHHNLKHRFQRSKMTNTKGSTHRIQNPKLYPPKKVQKRLYRHCHKPRCYLYTLQQQKKKTRRHLPSTWHCKRIGPCWLEWRRQETNAAKHHETTVLQI